MSQAISNLFDDARDASSGVEGEIFGRRAQVFEDSSSGVSLFWVKFLYGDTEIDVVKWQTRVDVIEILEAGFAGTGIIDEVMP